MMALMQAHPHHRGRRWRRFLRQNRNFVFLAFMLVIILAIVVAIFWVMTSSRFAKVGGG